MAERRVDGSRSSRARRIAIGVVGGLVTVAGLALLALPGPGLLVLFLGLTIMAGEFMWARRLKHRVERETTQAREVVRRRRARRERAAERRRARQQPRVDHGVPAGQEQSPPAVT